jgi:hypothetical protein
MFITKPYLTVGSNLTARLFAGFRSIKIRPRYYNTFGLYSMCIEQEDIP